VDAGTELMKFESCDGLEDYITSTTIGEGRGVCLGKKCYDINTLHDWREHTPYGDLVNPMTREPYTDPDNLIPDNFAAEEEDDDDLLFQMYMDDSWQDNMTDDWDAQAIALMSLVDQDDDDDMMEMA